MFEGSFFTFRDFGGGSLAFLHALRVVDARNSLLRVGGGAKVGILSIGPHLGVRVLNDDPSNASNRTGDRSNFRRVPALCRVLRVVAMCHLRPVKVSCRGRVTVHAVEFDRACRPIGDYAGHVTNADFCIIATVTSAYSVTQGSFTPQREREMVP